MDERSESLVALFETLGRLSGYRTRASHADARIVAGEVGGLVAHLAGLVSAPPRPTIEGPPPRAVGVAMAQALFAAPHLEITLAPAGSPPGAPAISPSDAMAEALGLPRWELEEIREDVDARVTRAMWQGRAIQWLWSRHDSPRHDPSGLFQVLFPGRDATRAVRFERRGTRLYAVVAAAGPPQEALFLPWLPEATLRDLPGHRSVSRFVEPPVLRAVGRAMGGGMPEVCDALDNLVTSIPEEGAGRFLEHDRWRSEGWSEITGLGQRVADAQLREAIGVDVFDEDRWIRATTDGIALEGPRRLFDRRALGRMTLVVHGLFAEMLARLASGRSIEPAHQAPLFDLLPYTQHALTPLLDWTQRADVVEHVAARVGASDDDVAAALSTARKIWLKASESTWGGAPTLERPNTVQSLLAIHLAVTQASLHRVARRAPDPRADHGTVLPLFLASYVKTAPLGRLWRATDGQLPRPEDVIGTWFWGTWQRVLAADNGTMGF